MAVDVNANLTVATPTVPRQLNVSDFATAATGANAEVTQAQVLAELVLILNKLSATLAVTVANFPATQPVSGTITISNPTTGTPDVTDRAARLLGHVTVDSAPTTAVTGPLTDTQLRANPVPVTGSVTTPALTDTQLRASAVPVSNASLPLPTGAAKDSTLTDGTQRVGGIVAVSGPATDAQMRASPIPVSNSSLPLPTGAATEATLSGQRTSIDLRFSGGKKPVSGVLSTAGDNTIATPATGKKIRLLWIAFFPRTDNTAPNIVTVKLSALQPYTAEATAHWEAFDGAVNDPLILNLSSTQPVLYSAHYQEV